MTQPVASTRHAVARSGFTNPLSLAIKVTDSAFVKVYADDLLLTLGVDYTISGLGDDNGIEVDITDGEDVGSYVDVLTFAAVFEPLYEQDADLSAGGTFGLAFEAAIDALNRQIQSLDDRLRRSLTLPPTYADDAQIAFPIPETGRVLVGNADETGYENGPTVPEIDIIVGLTAEIVALNAVVDDIAALGPIATAISAVEANLIDVQNAAENALLAKGYATEAEDVEVEPGLYSAYHWAQKAADNAAASILPPQGRLTLTENVPVTTADVNGATTIWYDECFGDRVPLSDGVGWEMRSIGGGLSMALDNNAGHAGYHASGVIYDVFVFDDAGTLRIGTGPSWAAGAVAGSNTNGASYRGTGAGSTELEKFGGFDVNKNAITLRFGSAAGNTVAVPAREATYLGSFEATADGQASDSVTKRCVFNAYNQVLRAIDLRIAGGATYTYNTATWRQAENDANFFAKVLFGLAGGLVDVEYSALVSNSTSTPRYVNTGIGLTSLVPVGRIGWDTCSDTHFCQPIARYSGPVGIGRHALVPLEKANGTDTQTFYEPSGTVRQDGLFGTVLL